MARLRIRWMRRARSELDVGFTHLLIAVCSFLALLGALVAVGVALYNDPDAPTVSTSTVAAPGGKTIDFAAQPAPGWKPLDPKLQPAAGATEHKVTLHARELQLEIAPGVNQEMWTWCRTGAVPQ